MAETLISALANIMSLRRWNIQPQVEGWTESENIGFYTHLAYALARQLTTVTEDEMGHLLKRCLLKSFNKYLLSDVSIASRDVLKTKDASVWPALINESAKKASLLFPRAISGNFCRYMDYPGSYQDLEPAIPPQRLKYLETMIKYCQFAVAADEIRFNREFFKASGYEQVDIDLKRKIGELPEILRIEMVTAHKALIPYLERIRRLKYLRRWNRVSRSVESSVLGHTYVVAILALVFSHLSRNEVPPSEQKSFVFKAMLRALFHDVPEALAGDVITPVKDMIDRVKRDSPPPEGKSTWDQVEEAVCDDFLDGLPEPIKKDLTERRLLVSLDDSKPHSLDSLVKECDRLALIAECLFEREYGSSHREMAAALESYLAKLRNSEWSAIREYAMTLLLEIPNRLT